MRGELTEKQKQFCSEYLIDLNATQAAIRAGYSAKTASRIAIELLNKTHVAECIQKKQSTRERRTEITQDRVLKELANIAFANGTNYAKIAKVNGEILVGMVPTDDLTEDQKAAISCIKQTRNGIEVGSYDKVKALELIGKHLGMFKDVPQGNGDIEDLTPLAELLAVDDE